MRRSAALRVLLDLMGERDIALFPTGMESREAFALGDRGLNFYLIGSMGLVSALALGIAEVRPQRRVWAVDGDGGTLMDMGTMALIAAQRPANLTHLVLDNESYQSTGEQPSISGVVPLDGVALAVGYRLVERVSTEEELRSALRGAARTAGPHFILAKVEPGGEEGVPRVSLAPEEMTLRLIQSLAGG